MIDPNAKTSSQQREKSTGSCEVSFFLICSISFFRAISCQSLKLTLFTQQTSRETLYIVSYKAVYEKLTQAIQFFANFFRCIALLLIIHISYPFCLRNSVSISFFEQVSEIAIAENLR